ncbi:hypothetical protein [Paraburkholderia humisilvae]|uniref:Uncharacterized protein n=1 Tax=Paraburkholderia humisilvae TaxID=627669 RepID=A0A6J5DN36_9BURK|nr:hypothetical protein [Paraburkholderia humisilvae]CAB3754927.1 hypothetical protein LMG29542_02492 [Paraburkholderia humisilvae]
MAITNNTNHQDSWFRRNDWARPLIASLLVILAPMVAATLADGIVFTIPSWVNVVASVGGCVGLFLGALKARLTDTLSAKLFCAVGVIFGYVLAIWQIIQILKH